MRIRRWEPFSDFITLRATMDRFIGDDVGYVAGMARVPEVRFDVYQTDDDVVVKASLPGWSPEDVDINITGETLTVKGKVKPVAGEEEDRNYYLKETRRVSFSRSLTLPLPIKVDEVDAVFENGILTMHIPKSEEVKPHQIRVKAREAISSG